MGADYTFACAQVRCAEKYLLNRERLGVMVEARTMEDACKVLQDARYGTEGQVIQPASYEKTLAQETEKLYQFLGSIVPDPKVLRLFSYPADYHNIKALLKAEFLDIDGSQALLPGGAIEPAAMAVLVRERNTIPMTTRMKKALEEAVDTHARTRDPQLVDLICDKACYEDVREAAQETGNRFAQGYVRLLIDTLNLKTFVRCQRMGQPWSFFGNVFLPGGNIDEKVFVAGYEEPFQQFAGRLIVYDLLEAAEEGGAQMKETGSFTALERLCDNALIRYVRQAKYISFGLEPLIAYMVARQMETKNVRIILAGKAAGLDPERIRERVRETYG